MIQRFRLHISTDFGVQQQSAELRTKDQLPVHQRIQQRLLPDPVAREKQLLGPLVPDRKRKHAAQVLRTINAPLIVSMNDRFGVAVGVELVTELFQLLAQFEVVVDLAVEDDPRGTVLVVNRLLTAFQVDDREPAHPEANGAINVKTVVVRPAMANRVAHARQQLFVNRLAVVSNESNDATHIAVKSAGACPGGGPRGGRPGVRRVLVLRVAAGGAYLPRAPSA